MFKTMQISEYEQIIKYRLWFDVEMRYKSISAGHLSESAMLWFDVEMRYKSIKGYRRGRKKLLWFDVEMRYKSMHTRQYIR